MMLLRLGLLPLLLLFTLTTCDRAPVGPGAELPPDSKVKGIPSYQQFTYTDPIAGPDPITVEVVRLAGDGGRLRMTAHSPASFEQYTLDSVGPDRFTHIGQYGDTVALTGTILSYHPQETSLDRTFHELQASTPPYPLRYREIVSEQPLYADTPDGAVYEYRTAYPTLPADDPLATVLNYELYRFYYGQEAGYDFDTPPDFGEEITTDAQTALEEVRSGLDPDDEFRLPGAARETIIQVLRNSPDVLVLASHFYMYEGGAHGMYGTTYLNLLDSPAEGLLSENPLHLFGSEESEARAELQTWLNAYASKQTGPLAEQLQGLFEDELPLTDNVALLPSGLLFTYNPYEVGPYALGQVEVLLPVGEFRELLYEDDRKLWAGDN